MYKTLFRFPVIDAPVHSFGLLMMLAFLIGIYLAGKRAERLGHDCHLAMDMGLIALFTGVLGARVWYLVTYRAKYDFRLFAIWDGGFVWWAGMIGGAAVAGWLWTRGRRGTSTNRRKRTLAGVLVLLAGVIAGRAAHVSGWSLSEEMRERRSLYLKELTLAEWNVEEAAAEMGMTGAELERERVRTRVYGLDVFKIWEGGLVLYGGVILATGSVIFFVYRKGVSVWQAGDFIGPSLAIALAFGRLGCFLNGCCWGDVVDPPRWWAIRFPADSYAYNQHLDAGRITEEWTKSLPVYPTQLMESFWAVLMWGCLSLWYERKKRPVGEVFILWGVLYAPVRFWLESIRADTELAFWGLSISQVVSVVLFCVCTMCLLLRRGAWRARQVREGA